MTHSAYWMRKFKPQPPEKQNQQIITGPEVLWEKAVEYFTFCQAEPLKEEKIVSADGAPMKVELSKMRAMTIEGLCAHIGIGKRTWYQYANGDRKREDLAEVIDRIQTIIDAQKLEGAMAGLLNATIVGRLCGLAEKTELTGKDGGAIETKHSADEGFAAICAALDAAAIAKSRGASGKGGVDSESTA